MADDPGRADASPEQSGLVKIQPDALRNDSLQGMLIRTASGRLVANDAFCTLFGYTPDELAALEYLALYHPDDRPTVSQRMQARSSGDTTNRRYEIRGSHKNGATLWLECMTRAVEWQGERATQIIMLDVSARHEAEEALKRSEESYRLVINNSIQGLAILTPASGFVFVNDAFCRIFGYERGELIGNPAVILHPDNRDELIMRVRARARGNEDAKRYEIGACKKDGTKLWVEYLSSVTDWNGGRATLLAALDITERKNTERRLEEQERVFRDMFQMAPVAMYRAKGGKIVDMNSALAELTGYETAELTGRALAELMPPEDAARAGELHALRKSGTENIELEHRLVRRDGRVIWVASYVSYADNHAAAERTTICHVVDVTKRRKAEQDARERESLYRALVASSLQGVMIAASDGRPLYVNEAYARMYGYTPPEIMGLSSTRVLYAPDEKAKLDGFIAARSQGDASVRRYELKGVRKDGTIFWTEQLTSTIDWDGESATQILSIELTERRQAEMASSGG